MRAGLVYDILNKEYESYFVSVTKSIVVLKLEKELKKLSVKIRLWGICHSQYKKTLFNPREWGFSQQ